MNNPELPRLGEPITIDTAAQNADRALELYQRGFFEGALTVAERTHRAINADVTTEGNPRFDDIRMVCETVGLRAWRQLDERGLRPSGHYGFVMHAQVTELRAARWSFRAQRD